MFTLASFLTKGLLAGLDDTLGGCIQGHGIRTADVLMIVPQLCAEFVQIEYRGKSACGMVNDLAGGDHRIVDETVRIDIVVHDLPLLRGEFDAHPDRLHRESPRFPEYISLRGGGRRKYRK